MKTSLLLAAVVTLAGCATVHWVKPGADLQDFSADSEGCKLESWTATPEPEQQGPPCNADGSYMNCSPRASEGPARAYPRTWAEMEALAERDKARRGTYGHCMQQRGWQRQPV
jgi:hypothetical protein